MRAKNKTTQVLLAAGALLIIAAVSYCLPEGDALAEADRCLRCGLVCYDRDSDADVRHFSNPADI